MKYSISDSDDAYIDIGDLVLIVSADDHSKHGIGLYLGLATRGDSSWIDNRHRNFHAFLWKGRIATFDRPYWDFNVISKRAVI